MLESALIALVAGLILQPLGVHVLRARRILDVPNARSSHGTPTVRGGGVAVVAALVLGALLAGAADSRDGQVVLVALVLCAAVGAAEDLHGVPVLRGLALLLLATAPLAALVPGPAAERIVAGGFAVLFGLAVVNATNFMDGINGISAAEGVVGGVTYAVLGHMAGLGAVAVVGAATASAFLSFAPDNVPLARAFLGDSGSYGLGAVLAGLAMVLVVHGVPPEAVLAPIAIYVADTGTTLLRRWRSGQPWHRPHRTHVYQRLTDLGLSYSAVSGLVLVFGTLSAVLGAASFNGAALRVPADLALAALVAGYLALPHLLATRADAVSDQHRSHGAIARVRWGR